MDNQIVTSPIFYMGNKQKLIKRGLINFFPENINKFIDVFAGSGTVSFNAKANTYMLNDKNEQLMLLLKWFSENEPERIICNIKDIVQRYELEYGMGEKISFDNRSKFYNKKLAEIHKQNYKKLRNDYNKHKDVMLLYVLTIYCFCHQMRTDKQGNFNMPCGNGVFTKENMEWIQASGEWFANNNFVLTNNDFRKLKVDGLHNEDFVYLDPPYLNTTATYNENQGWTSKDETDLHSLCEQLTSNGIKFAMSNVFLCKGQENTQLVEWCKNNNYRVEHLQGVYSACGKGNSKADDVLIMNY